MILNYNGKRSLGNLLDWCLDSALNQTYPNLEVVFADNGSNDESITYVNTHYGNKLKIAALGKNYGFCLGNNYAVSQVSNDTQYLLFLNPDAVLSKNYVETLVSYMKSNPNVAACQGVQNQEKQSSLGGLITQNGLSVVVDLRYLQAIKHDKLQPIDVLFVHGSAMLVRRDLFIKLNGFSQELFMYYDEVDLCCRFRASGYKIMGIPSVTYLHKGGTPWRNLNNWYFTTRNRWIITIRYIPLRFLPQCVSTFAIDFTMTIYRSFRCRKKEWRKSYFDILAYLFKNFNKELAKRHRWKAVQSLIVNYLVPYSLSDLFEDYVISGRLLPDLEGTPSFLNLEQEIVRYLAKANLSATCTE